MRDEKRIPEVCRELERCWRAFPDLRLGQFLMNAVGDMRLFYIEDDELIEHVKEFSYKFAKEQLNGKA